MKETTKRFLPVLFLFLILTALFLTATSPLEKWGADREVLIIGNLFLFIITFLSYRLSLRGLSSPNPHAFVRSVYGGIMLKLFLCIIVAFIYIARFGKELNKPALFTCMGLYLVYTFLEVNTLMKLLRRNNG